jgi:hypothetical protein
MSHILWDISISQNTTESLLNICTTNTVLELNEFTAASTKLHSEHVERVLLPTFARRIHRGFDPRGFVPESAVAQSREKHLDARAVTLLG